MPVGEYYDTYPKLPILGLMTLLGAQTILLRHTAYFTPNRSKDVDANIESQVDADFANCVDDRHSIS